MTASTLLMILDVGKGASSLNPLVLTEVLRDRLRSVSHAVFLQILLW